MIHYIKNLAFHLNADTFELTPIKVTCDSSHDTVIKGLNDQCKIFHTEAFQGKIKDPILIIWSSKESYKRNVL